MRKFFRMKSVLFGLLAILVIGGGVAAAIVNYNLNKTVTCNYTVNETVTTVEVDLFTDLLGTTPLGDTITFAAVNEGGTPQGAVYFDATKILPASIVVTSSQVGFNYIVGTPSGATGFCPIAIFLTGATPPGGSFSFTVTGHS